MTETSYVVAIGLNPLDDVFRGGAGDFLNEIARSFCGMAADMSSSVFKFAADKTAFDLQAGYLVENYNTVFFASVLILTGLLLCSGIMAALRGDPHIVTRAFAVAGTTIIGSFVALGLLQLVLNSADGLAAAFGNGDQLGAELVDLLEQLPDRGNFALSMVMSLTVTMFSFLLFILLFVRKIAIIALAVFIPLYLAGQGTAVTQNWMRRASEMLAALIFVKPVIYAIFTLGTDIALETAGAGAGQEAGSYADQTLALLTFISLMLASTLAPFGLFRVIGFADVQLTRSVGSAGRRAAASFGHGAGAMLGATSRDTFRGIGARLQTRNRGGISVAASGGALVTDSWALDLGTGPTPVGPTRVRETAGRSRQLSTDADEGTGEVRRLDGQGAAIRAGDTAAVFTQPAGALPDQPETPGVSYGTAGRARTTRADKREAARAQADGALARGRDARDRPVTAHGQLGAAKTSVTTAQTAVDTAAGILPATTRPVAGTPPLPPDPAAVSTPTANRTAAVGALASTVTTQVSDAQADTGAERASAPAAKTLRQNPAQVGKGQIDRDSGAARLPDNLGSLVRGGWGSVRTGVNRLRNSLPGLRTDARNPLARLLSDDPVDYVTGEVSLPQTDVDLPGLLPLVLERTHLSSYRAGRHFGTTWASTLDQRLESDSEGVCLTLADSRTLAYPTPPADGTPVLPREGDRWPLTADPTNGGYTVTDPQTGRSLHFPPVGPGVEVAARQVAVLPLAAVTDRNDHRIDIDRTPDGTPTAVRHSGGYTIIVDTTGTGQVTALRLDTDADQRRALVQFGYDTDGRLTEVVNSSGRPLRFSYDDKNRLTGWVDRNDHWYVYTYDQAGRCVRGTGSGGYLTATFTYRPEIRTTVFTDSFGHQRTVTYNDRGQVVTETDALGNTTHSTWSRYDWLVRRTDPLGRSWTYDHDEVGNVLRAVRPDGEAAHLAYDQQSRPLVVVQPDGTRWEHTYDQHGNLTTTTDPLGAVTRYTYDPNRPGHLAAVTDALGHTTRIETNPAGLPVRVISPSGGTTQIRYGPDGRTRTVVDPVGGENRYTWTVEGKLTSRTDPDNTVEHWTYDAEGNLVEQVDAAGLTTRYEYTHFDLPAARTDPDGTRLAFTHDTELRLTSVTNPQGMVWSYTYDPAGRLIAENDFDGRELTYTHDPTGQLLTRTNGIRQTTAFTRNLHGDVVEKRTPSGTTRITYDTAGQIVRATNPDTDCTLTYDPLGRMLAETVNGRTTTFAYDPLGHRTRRVTPSGTSSDWQWDPDGSPTSLRIGGQTLTFAHDAAGRETARHLATGLGIAFGWDSVHRLVSQTVTTGPAAAAVGHPRQLVHQRTWTYSPDSYVTTADDLHHGTRHYTLDRARRVTAVAGTNWQETYAYDPAGNLTHATWPQATRTDDNLDADAQGARAYAGTRLRGAGAVRYEHDAQGRATLRQQKRLSAPPRTWRYTWDAEDRLVGVVTPDGERWRYRYDPFGRRVAKQRVAFNGTVLDQTDYTWDGPRLAEQHHDNARQVRTWEWEPGTHRPLAQLEHRPTPDNTGEIQVTGPAHDTAPRFHDDQPHGDHNQAWYDTRFYAIVTDLIGTPTHLLNPDGSTAWQHHTTLWGLPTQATFGQVDCPLRFPGQYHDPETGLHYNYHRHYDPTTARYTSPDPLGLTPHPNPTTYVPNPLTWIDALGLAPCQVTAYHYTDKKGYNAIRAGNPYRIIPGSSKNGPGPFFTLKSPGELTNPNSFKKLGITSSKSQYVIEFVIQRDRLVPMAGGRGRGEIVFFTPGGIEIPRSDVNYIGPTANWQPR